MTRAELHIHFSGAAERLTAEFTVDPESHMLTPRKMAERAGSPDRAKMNPVRFWICQTTHTWKASPMIYMFDGTQYGAVAAGSNIIALAIQD